jgi:L-alanine-DL-glutamate epimerase-like enolase superfamily enzyme
MNTPIAMAIWLGERLFGAWDVSEPAAEGAADIVRTKLLAEAREGRILPANLLT